MGFISVIWGIVSLLGMFLAFLPFLGILNWFVVPFAAIGVVLGYLAKSPDGLEKKSAGRLGFICSLVALCLSLFRLFLGGGIF